VSRTFLFLEARHENPEHHRGMEYYPFLLSLLRNLGVDARWWVVAVPKRLVRQGETYRLELAPAMTRLLAEQLAAWRPDRLATNDILSDEVLAAVRAASPATKVVYVAESLHYAVTTAQALTLLLGDDAPDPGDLRERLFVQAAPPVFDRRFLGDDKPGAAASLSASGRPAVASRSDSDRRGGRTDFHRLAVPVDCPYRRAAAANPYYAHLNTDVVRSFRGCTFCYVPVHAAKTRGAALSVREAVATTVQQIQAHQAAADPDVARFQYLVEQSIVGENVDLLLEQVVRLDLRPLVIVTMLRLDTLVARKGRFEALLPELQRRGHHLRLVSLGAENLSDVENERMNKGLTRAQILASHAVIQSLARDYAAAFSADELSGILFTPWTRPADLRENIQAARELGFSWLLKNLGTVLQLWEATPITELARHDGLVADTFGSIGQLSLSCSPTTALHEIPWRFQDPRVETLHALLIRLDPSPSQAMLPQDDLRRTEIRREVATLAPALAADPIGLRLALVDAVEALGADASVRELFAHVRAQPVA